MQIPELFLIFLRPLNRLCIPYMVTGSTAAMIYGMPRLTNDIDLVVHLKLSDIVNFNKEFTAERFYVPPEEVLRAEIARRQRGHFNLIDHETGFKADIYLMGQDELHHWAMNKRIEYSIENEKIWIASPEYIILRKLQYYREGRASKHLDDIKNIIDVSESKIDMMILREKVTGLHLEEEWNLVNKRR